MGERRKHKSLWDHEEEARHLSGISGHHSWTGMDRHSSHDSGRYHEFSESRTTIMRKSRDHSGYQSWESIEEDPIPLMNGNFKNTLKENDMVGGERFYEEMSPGYDNMEMHDYIRRRDYGGSHLQRYPGRGRSRSRSRSRTKGRSPSRSYSRGMEREGGKGFSRSSIRSRSYDNARACSRSRSPMVDFRRQSYEWSGRRNNSEKPSQICREFAGGSCRRGSQCRFLHPNNMSCRDGGLMEDDINEEWRSRADLSHVPKHSYRRGSGYESWNDISDHYHKEDEQFRKKNRNAVPCKDFIKGYCRWGDACRYSHTSAYDVNFGRYTRNVSHEKYVEREQYKNTKPLCKFFAAGKCDRKNCRFSHEDPNFNDHNGLPSEGTACGSSRETRKCWNGPTWDDEARPSGNRKSIGWGGCHVTNAAGAGKTSGGQNDNREGQSDTSKSWKHPTWDDEARPLGTWKSSGWGEITFTNAFAAGTASGEHNDNREGRSDVSKYWNGPTWDDEARILDAQKFTGWGACTTTNTEGEGSANGGQNDNREGWTDTSKCLNHATWDDEARPLDAQKSIGLGEGTVTNAVCVGNVSGGPNENRQGRGNRNKCWNGPTWDDEVRSSGNQKSTGWGVSTVANSASTKNASSGQNNNKEGWNLESKEKDFVTSGHTSSTLWQGTHNSVHCRVPGCKIKQETRFPNNPLGGAGLVSATSVQGDPGSISLNLFSSMGNVQDNGEHGYAQPGNHSLAQATVPIVVVELSHPSSVCMEFDDSKEKHSKSPTPRKEVLVTKSEVAEGNKVVEETIKGIQEDKQAGMLDSLGKEEEGNSNKDERGLRMFKNSLVEFVKEILKLKWKEGRMSRDAHKAVVKKVVDKISSSIQADYIPKTQDKVDLYLSHSKPKITKLVQAYVDRCPKGEPCS